MKTQYIVKLLGEKLGEKHWGIYDVYKEDYIRNPFNVIDVYTNEKVAQQTAEELNWVAERI